MDGLAADELGMLPLELLEPILSLLPLPALCRFRTVCKAWNSLICEPAFGALYMRRHGEQDAHFIVVQEKKGYSFLDTSERRWYTIERCEPGGANHSFWIIQSVAVDGGLLCQYSYNYTTGAGVFVSNPIAKISRRLPPLPGNPSKTDSARVYIVVDNITQSYKVFAMPRIGFFRPLMVLYESTTNQWRRLRVPDCDFPTGSRLCSVFFHGLLYVLMSPSEMMAAQDCLWCYNHVEGVWTNTHVNLHIRPLHRFNEPPQLIVSDGRLFLASWIRPEAYAEHERPPRIIKSLLQAGWSYELSEVHLGGESALSRVFEMTEAVMSQLGSVHVKAVGCCKCIVFISACYGISMVYDLRASSWDLVPANPLTPIHPQKPRRLLHGSQAMNLNLPQWDVQHEIE